MNTNYLKIAIMAAVSDGSIQDAESAMLMKLRSSHPIFKSISDSEAQAATVDVYNKLSAGMEYKYILEDIGSQLSSDQKSAAYAIAREICVADFKMFPEENDFIILIEELWKIKKAVKSSVDRSIQLRYFTD